MLRGSFFNLISKVSNWILVAAGLVLLVYQLNGFLNEDVDSHNHHHNHDKHEHSHKNGKKHTH